MNEQNKTFVYFLCYLFNRHTKTRFAKGRSTLANRMLPKSRTKQERTTRINSDKAYYYKIDDYCCASYEWSVTR